MNDGGVFERPMADVINRLTRAGYGEVFRGEPGGVLGAQSGLPHRPSELEIERIERFEGFSDPEYKPIVLALHCRTHGCRGTFVVPYGKDMSSTDAALIRDIPDARRR